MLDRLWRWLGYRKIWLVDFDGELNQRWAKPIKLAGYGEVLLAYRMWEIDRKVICLPGGKTIGRGYVTNWFEEFST